MRTRLVGELATNHNGYIDMAKKMAESLAQAGFWAAKGQYRTPREEWKTKDYSSVPYSFGATYFDHRAAVDLTIPEHMELADFCRRLGLEYYVSVWDLEGVAVAADISRYIKIPSAINSNIAILEAVRKTGRKSILSAGMLTMPGIMTAISILGDNLDTVLISTCAYPTKVEDMGLSRILAIRAIRGTKTFPPFKVGYSGHNLGTNQDALVLALGGNMIERHYTLDKKLKGPDHFMSLEPAEIVDLADAIRNAEFALGSYEFGILDCEQKFAKKVGRV